MNTITVSKKINSESKILYSIVADYHERHKLILPTPPFLWLKVLEGGYGAGTKIEFAMKFFGSTSVMRAVISEPEPGKVLKEEAEDGSVATLFYFEEDSAQTTVSISTTFRIGTGIFAKLQFWISKKLLTKVYHQELINLESLALKNKVDNS